ncbi:MAG: FkbM family methyltransferase [Thermoanaerobaculia bacterium]
MRPLSETIRESALYDALRRFRGLLGNRGARYDALTLRVFERVLSRSSGYVDVGTHRGELLRHAVRLAPEGRHHAFEPIPALAASLGERFPRVTVHEAAVAEAPGRSQFRHVTNDSAYSGLRARLYDRPDPVVELLTVAVTTLDDAVGRDDVRLVKIDVEGGEHAVLLGARLLLRRCRPVVVFEAGWRSTGQYGVGPDDLVRLLGEECGYDVTTLPRWLDGRPCGTREEFARHWYRGDEYYFLASPRAA